MTYEGISHCCASIDVAITDLKLSDSEVNAWRSIKAFQHFPKFITFWDHLSSEEREKAFSSLAYLL